MRRAIAALALAVAVEAAGPWAAMAEPAPGPRKFAIAGGSMGGEMHRVATAVEAAVRARGDTLNLVTVESEGSCDNIKEVLAGNVAFALVQYDVAADAYSAGTAAIGLVGAAEPAVGSGDTAFRSWWMCAVDPTMAAIADLRVVAGIGSEHVHFMVRRPLAIDTFDMLEGRQVYVGRAGSGSFATAMNILGAGGITFGDVRFRPPDGRVMWEAGEEWESAKNEIGNRKSPLVAMIRTLAIGDRDAIDLTRNGTVTVQSLPASIMRVLIDNHRSYRPCQIEEDDYPGQPPGTVRTVCVDTVLLTNLAAPGAPTPGEVTAILQGLDDVARARPEGCSPNSREPACRSLVNLKFSGFGEDDIVPRHPSTLRFAASQRGGGGIRVLSVVFGGLGIVATFLLLWRRQAGSTTAPKGGFRDKLANPLLPIAGILLMMGLSALAVLVLERPTNPNVQRYRDAFWSMASFATGSFESGRLQTMGARIVGIVTTLGGLVFLGWFTASLTTFLSTGRALLAWAPRRHVVIVNVRPALLRLVGILRSRGPCRVPKVHVVARDLPSRLRHVLLRTRGVSVHDLNAEDADDFRRVHPDRARRVIVLDEGSADLSTGPGARTDDRTGFHPLRVVRALRQLSDAGTTPCRAPRRETEPLPGSEADRYARAAPAPWTAVETFRRWPDELFASYGDWLLPLKLRDATNRLVARACETPRVAAVVSNLLLFREDSAEIYTCVLPASARGWRWRDLRRRLLDERQNRSVTPIGLFRPEWGAEVARAIAGDEGPGLQAPPLHGQVLLSPSPDLAAQAGDHLIALADDEAALVRVVAAATKGSPPPEPMFPDPPGPGAGTVLPPRGNAAHP